MSEKLIVVDGSKAEKYQMLYRQVMAVAEAERDPIALMANIAAMLHQTFDFWWTGFYRVVDEELVLGPFQGPMACMRIGYSRGVCGTAWAEGRTVVVDDVDKFPGHIACSSLSRSEIVVPIRRNGVIIGVLDIDSRYLSTFDSIDQEWLERIVEQISK